MFCIKFHLLNRKGIDNLILIDVTNKSYKVNLYVFVDSKKTYLNETNK